MAKQHRATAPRSKMSKRKQPGRGPVRRRRAAALGASRAGVPSQPASHVLVAEPPAPAKKPAYYEAISVYETGVRALQRHDFATAADHFRMVIQRFPEERELVERSTLYLRVCERETATRATLPGTPGDRVYAATVALNAGDADRAVRLLREALEMDAENDHAQYILAVALAERSFQADAIRALRQAIELNPDNRSLARQDPDLAVLREAEACRQLLDAPVPVDRKRPKARR